ncbi:hypothetical protein RFI_26996 [Reticulomyxa filosa]|uniref:Uncharacterized protein n=1 Tax=Reticulomyxa filosa TaxID=46433 RepID=X6MAA6_RETFI|nr:hypothetical protein RFI_26996 [Reticulomyxa filosa]|eukprot:ETO10382.1 hypothetical protein RFI_26996 [Reticulomyxa filosa]
MLALPQKDDNKRDNHLLTEKKRMKEHRVEEKKLQYTNKKVEKKGKKINEILFYYVCVDPALSSSDVDRAIICVVMIAVGIAYTGT